MGLITPQWGWAHCTTNLSGTPSTTPGTSVTPSSTANTDGTSVAAITNLAHDCEFLVIGCVTGGVSGTDTDALLDVLIDPAGGTTWNTAPLINDLLAGAAAPVSGSTSAGARWYFFPIWIKAGTSIGLRSRSSGGANAMRFVLYAYGGNSQPSSWWCGQAVTEIGVVAASSKGTTITPGGSGTFSAWANLGSALPAPCGAIQFAHQNVGSTGNVSQQYHTEFGVNSRRIGPTIWSQVGSLEQVAAMPTGPIFCNLASGSQLQVRSTTNISVADAIDVAAYVVH